MFLLKSILLTVADVHEAKVIGSGARLQTPTLFSDKATDITLTVPRAFGEEVPGRSYPSPLHKVDTEGVH